MPKDEVVQSVQDLLNYARWSTPEEDFPHKILMEDYAYLSDSQRYQKALILTLDGATQENSTKLEEAAIILGDLGSRHDQNPRLHYASSLNHFLAERYSEAHDSLARAKIFFGRTNNYGFQTLESCLVEKNESMRNKILELDYKPSRSYIINSTEYSPEILQRALEDSDAETVLVLDNISRLDKIKELFEDKIHTIETEQEIHEKYQRGRLRIILKNSNHGHPEKGLNLGIKKANQVRGDNILIVNEEGVAENAADYINSNRTLRPFFESKRKHVTFVATTTENTHGVPVVMNNIANQLKNHPDYQVSYIVNNFDNQEIRYYYQGEEHVFRDRADFAKFINATGIKIDIVHLHTWHFSDYYKPFHSERDETELPEFLREIGNPKLIYTDHSNPTEDLRRIGERNGIDYLELSNFEKQKFLYQRILDYVQNWEDGWVPTTILAKKQITELADIVTFVSETQRREEELMIPFYSCAQKSKVVMNGVDMVNHVSENLEIRAEELKERLGLPGKKVILYAGRMDAEKGIYDLAEAANAIHQRSSDVAFVYLGDANDEIKNKINNLAPEAELIFPGRIADREEIAAYYALADVVAQPTWGECFNQVVAEALAVGTPSVVSDFSATGEIYVKTGAALGAKVRDPKDLAQKIEELLNNEELYQRIQTTGQILVEQQLNIKSMYQQYLAIYDSL